ncbi:MAG: hypothetical protein PHP08_00415 [Candidatus Dojkabacteria bacterium]|nr:hypothetical protein [Candidatus Dojkabacteria bacterium]
MKYEKLTRDDLENTKICAGATTLTVDQLEEEIEADSEIGKKLKSIEKILQEEY